MKEWFYSAVLGKKKGNKLRRPKETQWLASPPTANAADIDAVKYNVFVRHRKKQRFGQHRYQPSSNVNMCILIIAPTHQKCVGLRTMKTTISPMFLREKAIYCDLFCAGGLLGEVGAATGLY
jgi:hypothetical protein